MVDEQLKASAMSWLCERHLQRVGRTRAHLFASATTTMISYTISHTAYLKLALHASKYPHRAVTGLLLGRDAGSGAVEIVDAVPLVHHWTSLSLATGIGLEMVRLNIPNHSVCPCTDVLSVLSMIFYLNLVTFTQTRDPILRPIPLLPISLATSRHLPCH